MESSCKLYPDVSNLIPDFKNIPKLTSSIAIQKIHYPNTLEDAENVRRYFALQEFFVLETAQSLSRSNVKKNTKIKNIQYKKHCFLFFKII
ncbi:hypothetical protein AGMMS49921_12240 [Endomicrobiia bacterium]|nr:hypothetical protein AGMMS49921_12240 [Endomicrobiia bacterium]